MEKKSEARTGNEENEMKDYHLIVDEIFTRYEAKDRIDDYQSALDQGKRIDVTFDRSDKNGDLYAYVSSDPYGQITILLPNEEVEGISYDADSVWRRGGKIDSYLVQIKEIDRDKRLVTVSYRQGREAKKLEAQKILSEGNCIINAKVFGVFEHMLLLDLGGFGIMGYLDIRDWSNLFLRTFRDRVSQNDVIQVAVLSPIDLNDKEMKKVYKRWFKSRAPEEIYRCSRAAFLSTSSWDMVVKNYAVGDVVRVTCTHTTKEHYFYGALKSLEDIDVLCSFSYKNCAITPKDIAVGSEYSGVIQVLDPEKQKFRINVLSVYN